MIRAVSFVLFGYGRHLVFCLILLGLSACGPMGAGGSPDGSAGLQSWQAWSYNTSQDIQSVSHIQQEDGVEKETTIQRLVLPALRDVKRHEQDGLYLTHRHAVTSSQVRYRWRLFEPMRWQGRVVDMDVRENRHLQRILAFWAVLKGGNKLHRVVTLRQHRDRIWLEFTPEKGQPAVFYPVNLNLPDGEWHHIDAKVTWLSGQKGRFRFALDGQQIIDYQGSILPANYQGQDIIHAIGVGRTKLQQDWRGKIAPGQVLDYADYRICLDQDICQD